MWRRPQPRRARAGAPLGLSSPLPASAPTRTRSRLRPRLQSQRLPKPLPRLPLRQHLRSAATLLGRSHAVSSLQLTSEAAAASHPETCIACSGTPSSFSARSLQGYVCGVAHGALMAPQVCQRLGQ